ncbi:RNA polymerase sigma factor [Actinomadura napierensis]|uniref:RNA polymerase sigma factor n=1 Tax=Actinomadura napierensis TaxID=267854 RepID=UPI0031D06F1B
MTYQQQTTGAIAVPLTRPGDGYEELFTAHFWGLVRLATLLGADDAEDVVQDAFVRLHRKRRTLRDQNAALAYLRSSVCNAARSRLRHLRMARRRHAQLAPPSEAGSAEHQVVHDEDVRALLAAVADLPGRQREVLVLRYWLDLSERDTAETLGIALGTVKAHTARAIAALGRRLKDEEAT